jgi:hypothetical protein
MGQLRGSGQRCLWAAPPMLNICSSRNSFENFCWCLPLLQSYRGSPTQSSKQQDFLPKVIFGNSSFRILPVFLKSTKPSNDDTSPTSEVPVGQILRFWIGDMNPNPLKIDL